MKQVWWKESGGGNGDKGTLYKDRIPDAIANLSPCNGEYKPSHCRDVTPKIERSSMVLGPPTFQPAEYYVISSPSLACSWLRHTSVLYTLSHTYQLMDRYSAHMCDMSPTLPLAWSEPDMLPSPNAPTPSPFAQGIMWVTKYDYTLRTFVWTDPARN